MSGVTKQKFLQSNDFRRIMAGSNGGAPFSLDRGADVSDCLKAIRDDRCSAGKLLLTCHNSTGKRSRDPALPSRYQSWDR